MEESSELIPVTFEKVMPSRSYTCVVLEAEEKQFAIYTNPASGKTMQQYLSSTKKERPSTHDLINYIFAGLDIKLKQVVINDLQEAVYFARIFVEQKVGESWSLVEIDARPSDCITLALLHKVPLYCTRKVLEQAIRYEE